MQHVDEGTLQALLDGELTAEEAAAAERHLAGCAACRVEQALLSTASAELSGALRLLDRPAPPAGAAAPRRSRRVAASAGWWGRPLARAAVLVLGFAAAASATLPGSPVRGWIESVLAPPAAPPRVAQAPAPAAVKPAPAAEEAPVAGVSITPLDGAARIVLREASPDLRVRAVLTEGAQVGVYASGAAADARFRTGPGRIEVVGAGAGELRIELPRAARTATVEVAGRPYLEKHGEELRLAVPAEDSAAAELSFRVGQ